MTKDEPVAWATPDFEEIMTNDLRNKHIAINSSTYKDYPIPLYLHPKPSPPLLTDERIAEILGIKYDILMREFAEYPNTCALTIVRNIEKEIRSKYEK